MKKITFYPEEEMATWLKETAIQKKKSVNKLVLYVLEIYKNREDNRAFILSERRDKIKKKLKGGNKK